MPFDWTVGQSSTVGMLPPSDSEDESSSDEEREAKPKAEPKPKVAAQVRARD